VYEGLILELAEAAAKMRRMANGRPLVEALLWQLIANGGPHSISYIKFRKPRLFV
jgi:hypothetical protein